MSNQDVRADLLILSQQLKATPYVEVVEMIVPESISLKKLKKLHQSQKLPTLPEEVLDTYAQLGGGGVQISWKCSLKKAGIEPYEQEDLNKVRGQINVQPLVSLGKQHSKANNTKHYASFTEEELEDVPHFRLIEAWDDVVNVGFLIDAEKYSIDNELYYVVEGAEGFSFPSINFQAYLQQLFHYKGFSDWQHPYLMEQTDRLDYYIDKIFK